VLHVGEGFNNQAVLAPRHPGRFVQHQMGDTLRMRTSEWLCRGRCPPSYGSSLAGNERWDTAGALLGADARHESVYLLRNPVERAWSALAIKIEKHESARCTRLRLSSFSHPRRVCAQGLFRPSGRPRYLKLGTATAPGR
jgi:hypothetical protein